jgi:DNA repair exonuclease SbcCD ATPase subunit
MNDRKKSNVLWLKKEELKRARECLEKLEPFLESSYSESKYNCYAKIQEEINQLLERNKPVRQSLVEKQVQILQEINSIQQNTNNLNNNEEEKKKFEESLRLFQTKLNDVKKNLDDLDQADNELKTVVKVIDVLRNNLSGGRPSSGAIVVRSLSREDLKNIFQTLKKILCQEKETSRPRTYCHTGVIAEKLRDTLSKSSKHPGQEFFRLTLDNKVVFYAFQHELDNLNDYQNKVVPLATGERWELEGHRWVADKYYLRRLKKIEE